MISDTTVPLLNPFSCCCINMGCGTPKVWPQTLSFVLNLSNACPQLLGGMGTLSGTLQYGLACEPPGTPPACGGLCGNWNNMFCGGIYSWCVDTPPLCGPFINYITLECIPGPANGFGIGMAGCVNAPLPYNKCLWRVTVYVARAFRVAEMPAPCPIIVGDDGPGPPQCPRQKDDCTWECVDCPADRTCNAACPPCTQCPEHIEHLCEANEICCSTGVPCPPCPECPDGHQCTGGCAPCNLCFITDISGSQPEDASCVGYCGGAGYHNMILTLTQTLCINPRDVRGCDPTTCTPADEVADKLGDFFLHMQCNNDYFQAACP